MVAVCPIICRFTDCKAMLANQPFLTNACPRGLGSMGVACNKQGS